MQPAGPWTPEQAAVLERAAASGDVKVVAFAGTGKTTTLEGIAREALPRRRILYLAFNRTVAEEARHRFPAWVTARTPHALAYAAVGYRYRSRLVTTPLALRRALEERLPHSLRVLQGFGRRRAAAAFAVLETLEAFCRSDAALPGPAHVPAWLVGALPEAEQAGFAAAAAQAARSAWRALTDPAATLPVTHDVYLKLWQLSRPRLPFDAILFDEAQDADPVVRALLLDQPVPRVVVGDPYQQLYAWRGAVNALQAFPGPELALTRSWRFGPAVAATANRILDILGERRRLVGGGPATATVLDRPDLGLETAVLTRSNAGAVAAALERLDKGRKVAVAGGVAHLVRLVEAAYAFSRGEPARHPDLLAFNDWQELEMMAETELGSGFRPVVQLVHDYGRQLPEVTRRLATATVPPSAAEVTIATVHRAKGGEWDHVRLWDDFPPFARTAGDGTVRIDRAEAHLWYVAVTRARRRLNLAGLGPRLEDSLRRARQAVYNG
ncbi:DNA helicase [Candidatus Hydrogenisulfobacillus filiaventi]|uniref:DNA 3'-5' helicase n=1 Tax=Candidatus Hydrogenisulfobacillus filiaventi TaxID=2707344 RepID=A0A6F8ZC03_9FIRM|nr:AAA family ATPase [Bacillota bacterium]CAB1127556.1 DNA helicase [Candidatus Hydrogenisulfobacillus filiaventi]